MTFETVQLTADGPVAIVTIAREAQLNALSQRFVVRFFSFSSLTSFARA